MGHWALKDKMPGTYDSAQTVAELRYKKLVVDNYIAGWRPVVDGNIPEKRRVPLDAPEDLALPGPSPMSPQACLLAIGNELGSAGSLEPAVPAASAPVPTEEREGFPVFRLDGDPFLKGAQREVEVASSYLFPPAACQVLNSRVGTVHLYSDGSASWCGAYSAGSPDSPVSSATFALSAYEWPGLAAPFNFCRTCYSSACLVKHGASVGEPPFAAKSSRSAPGTASSSSEAGSSSESSA